MNVHALTAAPEPNLATALARFEEQFTYPLGPGRTFRISHGDDYPRFFRAVGGARCFVAERAGEVLGVLGLAETTVTDARGVAHPAIYLGDLKVAPAARGGRVLPRLAGAAGEWCRARARRGFGVVMDGTPVTPDRYTGRLGVPPFREVAKVAVLRLPAVAFTSPPEGVAGGTGVPPHSAGEVGEDLRAGWGVSAFRESPQLTPHPPPAKPGGDLPLKGGGEDTFARLARGRVHTGGGNPAERSEAAPRWLVAPDGSACGRLEDTRRAKRLIADDGSEMRSAHLSCIGYASHSALASLLRVARASTNEALFAAVPMDQAGAVLAILNEPGVVVAPATVFAAGFEPGDVWSVNTAEI